MNNDLFKNDKKTKKNYFKITIQECIPEKDILAQDIYHNGVLLLRKGSTITRTQKNTLQRMGINIIVIRNQGYQEKVG